MVISELLYTDVWTNITEGVIFAIDFLLDSGASRTIISVNKNKNL